jgi:hypothetical protein
MQVQAGGKLVGEAGALWRELERLGSVKGVYITTVRPPGAWPWEWTPVYCGEAAEQTTGERCSDYIDASQCIILGDKRPCKNKKQPDICKCKFYTDLAARGLDVGIM